ncbi:hypothetical protein PGT21_013488 [Puccinia graminis f. sp. tritici]|uniref:protein S-acyltransferase n=2 Tax=Puccinia graminis f. sp. tritici TaxID=56615 RepID=E3L2M2_PUCGT|nr:uncharacterized protein PGTG_16799 [Puccinia graminis f. sp. tritici CRL 75-36-700-3]EFP90773.1 hypothetical protein PGTG_16799 [Puccinia graminis f. sp. tritici CRL 75-36-700-3]KAA1108464.1 hypothetical protein PGT21_013488 [Puccinia graminis f. sp. tritici]KAA1138589.1 hypothetical protein PGTUg99_030444 [Puccinia graminis f. sp. tritici]
MTQALSAPSIEELEDLILSCRYGDLEDVQEFVRRFGIAPLDDYVDEHGNSCLHMAAANGHEDVVQYLLQNLEKSSSIHRSNLPPASNTPLHWAAMNHHLGILKQLCVRLTTEQICQVNGRGMSAMSEAMGSINNIPPSTKPDPPANGEQAEEAEQIPIREQCVNYLVEMMKLGDTDSEPLTKDPPSDHQQPIPPTSDQPQDPVEKLNLNIQNTQLNDPKETSPVKALR